MFTIGTRLDLMFGAWTSDEIKVPAAAVDGSMCCLLETSAREAETTESRKKWESRNETHHRWVDKIKTIILKVIQFCIRQSLSCNLDIYLVRWWRNCRKYQSLGLSKISSFFKWKYILIEQERYREVFAYSHCIFKKTTLII